MIKLVAHKQEEEILCT